MNRNDLKKLNRMDYMLKVCRSFGFKILASNMRIQPDKELLNIILTGIIFDDIFYAGILKHSQNIAGFKNLSFNVHFNLKSVQMVIEIEPVEYPTMDTVINTVKLINYRMSNIKRLLPDVSVTQNEFARICGISKGRMFRILNEIFKPDIFLKENLLIQFINTYESRKQRT